MQSRLPLPQLAGYTAFAFALGVSINVLEPAVLGHKMLEFAPGWKNTALGLATFAGLIVAVLVQPIIGLLSDRTRTRIGRRAPYLLAGTALAILTHLLIATSPSLLLVVLGLLGLQLASNTVQGPWQALIPDRVPPAQHGLAAGMKATFDILGFIVGRHIGGSLVSQDRVLAAASLAAFIFALALLITLAAGSGRPAPLGSKSASDLPAWWHAFRHNWRADRPFAHWFANRLLFWGAITVINTFMLFYLIDIHGLPESGAQRLLGQLGVILGAAVLLVALPAGWLTDRVGRRPFIAGASLVASAGVGVLLLLPTPTGVLAGAGLLGMGTGVFLSGSWAMVTDLAPMEQAARYLGLANIASAGASALGRAFGGALIDPINRVTNTAFTGYAVVFGAAALALLLAGYAILRAPIGSRGDGQS